MKRILNALVALSVILGLGSCMNSKPYEPEEEFAPQDNVIYLLDQEGQPLEAVKVKSGVSFVNGGGYYVFYAGDMEGLTKDFITEGLKYEEDDTILGAAILSSLNGKTIDITAETLRFQLEAQIKKVLSIQMSNELDDEQVLSGEFTMTVDSEKNKTALTVNVHLNDGKTIYLNASVDYVPGGENDSLVTWGTEYSRPLTVAFYGDPAEEGFGPTMFISVGRVDYGMDLSRTSYIAVMAHESLFDGQPHLIDENLNKGKLYVQFTFFGDDWYVHGGQIIIKKNKGEHDYEVIISGATSTQYDGEEADRAFDSYWSGPMNDVYVEPVIESIFTVGKETHPVGSAIIDMTGSISHIYFTEKEGVTTVEDAKANNPVHVTVSAGKEFIILGLSTDRENFSVSYGGKLWNKDNLSTATYWVEYDLDSGEYHCKIMNMSLASGETPFSLEYKGPVTIIK